MDKLFEDFCKHKQYLENCSPRTIKFYKFCYMSWSRLVGSMPTKANCNQYIIALRESGISIYTINSYIRGLNSFFTWLHENEHCEAMKMKPLKAPKSVVKTFTNERIRRLLAFKPRTFTEHRLYAMLCLAIDTGARVDELITLTRNNVDFENLLIRVIGKGSKERIIPLSIECRKVLFKFLQRHDFDFVFPTRHGGKVYYRSALDQFKKLCKKQGVFGVRLSWHTLRHTFATNYLREGGNLIYLSRVLGHSDVSTTQIYVRSQPEDLALVHRKTSLLSRLA